MKRHHRLSVWPNETQLLLLKAATLSLSEANTAWQLFLTHNANQLDASGERLLSLIYFNIAIRLNQSHFLQSDLLKIKYYAVFSENRFLCNAFSPILSQLLNAAIPVLTLKGLAYHTLYYKNAGARKMMDIDIMVPPERFVDAALILEKNGWKTFKCTPLKNFDYKTSCALTYFDDANNSIDLHYHLLHFAYDKEADDEYWEAAVPFTWYHQTMLTLSSTDHLLHCCFHGNVVGDYIQPLRWIVDAFYIIASREIDWNRFIFLSEKKSLSLFMLNSLRYLKTHFNADIPPDVLISLENIKITFSDKWFYNGMHRKTNNFFVAQLFQFLVVIRSNNNKSFLYCCCEYLKNIASTKKLRYVPIKLPLKALHKIKNRMAAIL